MLSLLQFIFCGLLCALLAAFFEADTFSGTNMLAAWQPLLFAGVLTVGIGHTLQVVGQRSAPASHAAIIMSLEAVFAALGGWLWLNEHLDTRQFTGCALMLAGYYCHSFRCPAAVKLFLLRPKTPDGKASLKARLKASPDKEQQKLLFLSFCCQSALSRRFQRLSTSASNWPLIDRPQLHFTK
ncbi:DMT family transporter [Aliamphritea spongicola]|nr:DMT family transporter [Aliamphritea spongicola]